MHSFVGHTPVMLRKNYLPQLLYYLTLYVKLIDDKTLLFDGGSIGWLFLVVKGYFIYFASKSRGRPRLRCLAHPGEGGQVYGVSQPPRSVLRDSVHGRLGRRQRPVQVRWHRGA